MTDAPAKRRPWFQLHLSTCVVLMFVAGALVWANLCPCELIETYPTPHNYYEFFYRGRGWPIRQTLEGVYPGTFGASSDEGMNYFLAKNVKGHEFGQPLVVLCNISIGIAILLTSIILLEFVVRRRERKRAAQEPEP